MTVITVGSKYEVYVRSPSPSHRQTLKQPFQTLQIKWEVNIIVKKSSCVFFHASFSPCVFLCASVFTIIESLWYGKWVYIYVYYCMNQQMTIQQRNSAFFLAPNVEDCQKWDSGNLFFCFILKNLYKYIDLLYIHMNRTRTYIHTYAHIHMHIHICSK